jgi:hypothetical protein
MGSDSNRDRESFRGFFFLKFLIYVNEKMEGGKINNMNSQPLHAFFLASAW